MPRCSKAHRTLPSLSEMEEAGPTSEFASFWESLPLERRRKLLSVDRKSMFTRIREQFCSRCFGLFVLRYEEMKGAAALDCPACQEFYAGLVVSESGEIAVETSILENEPFTLFAEGKLREREREMQFMTGDICGSGFQKRPGNNMCALHSSPVPVEALLEYFKELPEEHKSALLTLREEDFAAELDAHLKYQLRICRDCRSNVMRAYRDLKPTAKGQPAEQPSLDLCSNFTLRVAERLVTVEGEGVSEFFNRAEDVESCKVLDQDDDLYDNPDHVRHAETPELAREALIDSAVLIYKSQIEVAFREQTAGHNALLLFVGLALQLMEEQLFNAFKELGAKEAEAELLDLVAKEKEKKEAGKQKRKGKKGPRAADKEELDSETSKPLQQQQQGQQCSALQQCSRCSGRAQNSSPVRALPISPLRQRPSGASPTKLPKGVPVAFKDALNSFEGESGGWEVQQPKRRNAVQSLKKVIVVASSVGGSSSGSASPERLRWSASVESGRSRSPFSRRVVPPPPEPPQRPAGQPQQNQRPMAVPLHAYSCSGTVQPPPPPPPPREPRPSSRTASQPSPRTAWMAGQEAAATAEIQRRSTAGHEWTPWSGRSPALSSQMNKLNLGPGNTVVGFPGRAATRKPIAATVQQVHDAFSLFHFSPVPQAAGPLAQKDKDSLAPSGYQLFGGTHSSYPLAPLAPVISL